MSEEVARFEGPFAVWSYTIGHGRLLLRRTKSSAHPTRVDILFKDVGWIYLPMSFENIRIQEAAHGEADHLLANIGPVRRSGRSLYCVSGPKYLGYVMAGGVVWKEDEGEYDDPSPLLE